jgi:transposase
VKLKNQIRSLYLAQGLELPRGHAAWTVEGLKKLQEMAQALLECTATELWRGQLHAILQELRELYQRIDTVEKRLDALGEADPATRLLQSADGIGSRTAEVVAVYLENPRRFKNGRAVSAYSGLVPRQYQSGELDRRGRITRRGPRLLRKMLVEAAWCMLRYNEWARQVVARISGGQRARKKQAVVALARKLLVRLWAMLRDGVPWNDQPPRAIGQPAIALV